MQKMQSGKDIQMYIAYRLISISFHLDRYNEMVRMSKWLYTLPFLILILCACAPQVHGVSLIASATITPSTISDSPSTVIERPISTEMDIWFSHPEVQPELLGRSYGILNSPHTRIYENLEDAANSAEQFRLAPEPPAYLAFDKTEEINGTTYVHLTDGGWMPMAELQPIEITAFSGLIISEVPTHPFGWVVHDTPGWTDSQASVSSGLIYPRYEVVTIIENVGDFSQLATGDWVKTKDLALVDLSKITTKLSSSCRWVDVDLTSQTLLVFEDCQPVFATLISSAKAPGITPTGNFTIFYKEERLPLFANERVADSDSFYLADVPWLMFYDENWAIHGAYWHDNFGEPWSHGCINVSPYDARWLYQWSKLGDIIVVHE